MLHLAWFSVLAAPLAIYIVLIALLTIPWIQKIALYANNFSTSWIDDLDTPEQWGFARNQVTPFHVTTEDGVRLHAWHILPRALYAKHEKELEGEIVKKDTEFSSTLAYRLLTESTTSKLILKFHGNAGHLLQHHRPAIYRSLSTIHEDAHLIVFSYRGFGRSSGSPTEAGLLTDGITMVEYAMNDLGILPANIALIGQSLGTAVVSAITDFYSTTAPLAIAPLSASLVAKRTRADFATIVLVAAFSDLRTLMLKYRIAGYVPMLAPIAWIPGVPRLLARIVHESWDSRARIARTVQQAIADAAARPARHVDLQILHALDDRDIHYANSVRLYDAALDAAIRAVGTGVQSCERGVELDGSLRRELRWHDVRVSLRLLKRGGHNEITVGTDVALAVARGLGLAGDGSPAIVG